MCTVTEAPKVISHMETEKMKVRERERERIEENNGNGIEAEGVYFLLLICQEMITTAIEKMRLRRRICANCTLIWQRATHCKQRKARTSVTPWLFRD